MFSLQLLGNTAVFGPDGPLTGPVSQRHRLALLVLLAAAHPRPVSRDKLFSFLWPDSDSERGRRLLNLAVHVIRRALGKAVIVSASDGLTLDLSQLRCDVKEFESARNAGEFDRAVAIYRGPYLDGFFLPGTPDLDHLVEVERARLSRMYALSLEHVAEQRSAEGDHAAAVEGWRRLTVVDPFNSRFALRLMTALEATGDPAGALKHARRHGELLAHELDAQPDAEVLRYAEYLRTAPVSRPTRPLPRTVAVLPFLNLSADPENEYFADGITEDVISHLSKIRALCVISRTSVMPFKARGPSLREIGARLGATTVLDGSVRRIGDRVRIVAQLIDVESDQHLWAETYDRQLTDIFAIQTDVALQISAALQAELSPDERARIRREPTGDLQAYQLYLQGRHCLIRFTAEGLKKSIEYFEQAIERDPNYALAYAGIAMASTELGEIGALRPAMAHQQARAAVNRALELNNDLAEAHCVLAFVKFVHEFDWIGAEWEFKRALELSPSDADTYDLYGRLCMTLDRHDDAIAMLTRAYELDPLAHRADVATALLRAGRYDEALPAAMRAIELDTRFPRGHATLGWALFLIGKQDEGLASLEQAIALTPGDTLFLAQLGQAYAMAGRTDEARGVLERLEVLSRTSYVSPYHWAYVHTGLGELDRAIDALERAYEERAGALYGIKGSFLFKSLHSHPRFRALLKKMDLG
ncbi:MAG: BTAD domain-containing putative transcriptional regulator [Gemmatimonadota bacterium]